MANEIELCYFAEITHREGLQLAVDKETHEQWEYKVNDQGKARVRKTTREDGVVCEETLKRRLSSTDLLGNTEDTTPISEEYFNAWVALFGTVGTLKERYVFRSKNVLLTLNEKELRLPDVKFEVDIMIDKASGQSSKWCKIDIEIDQLLEILEAHQLKPSDVSLSVTLSELPFKPEKFVSAVTKDPEERAGIDAFWKRFQFSKDNSDRGHGEKTDAS